LIHDARTHEYKTLWFHLHLQFVSSFTAHERAICRKQRYRILQEMENMTDPRQTNN